MTLDTLVVALGWALAVAATVTAAPQAIRIIRRKHTEGVSVGTCSGGAATMVAWTYYTISVDDIPALASSIGALTCWLAALVGLYVLRREPGILLLPSVAISVSLLLSFLGLSAVVAAVGGSAWALPQLRIALREKNLEGVSSVAYLLLALENLGWILYAAGTGHWVYAVPALIQGPACAIISWRARDDHRHRDIETVTR